MSSTGSPSSHSGEFSGESDTSMVLPSPSLFPLLATFQANVLRRIAWDMLFEHLGRMHADRRAITNKWRAVKSRQQNMSPENVLERTLPSNDSDWVARVGGRHCAGLPAIRDRLEVLLYAELRSRVAPAYRLRCTLLLLDETVGHGVRTILNRLLLPLLQPGRIRKFQRWYISFRQHRELVYTTAPEI
ncbi:unnamed protein product [Symbiodinium sp. CCMP2592]|nr:unnamed protein product [Symbiodinium sp. CCMP2592]